MYRTESRQLKVMNIKKVNLGHFLFRHPVDRTATVGSTTPYFPVISRIHYFYGKFGSSFIDFSWFFRIKIKYFSFWVSVIWNVLYCHISKISLHFPRIPCNDIFLTFSRYLLTCLAQLLEEKLSRSFYKNWISRMKYILFVQGLSTLCNPRRILYENNITLSR